MENKENMVYVPLDQYNKGVAAMAKIEAFAAYVNSEKYTVDREMAAAILDFTLRSDE